MTKDKKIISELNPTLKIIRDNKPKWYLPETRREGYRNLHKINRYGLLLRSDHVLKLNQKYNDKIEKIPSVNKMINHKYFCSLLVGKDQDILYEKYADDFNKNKNDGNFAIFINSRCFGGGCFFLNLFETIYFSSLNH